MVAGELGDTGEGEVVGDVDVVGAVDEALGDAGAETEADGVGAAAEPDGLAWPQAVNPAAEKAVAVRNAAQSRGRLSMLAPSLPQAGARGNLR